MEIHHVVEHITELLVTRIDGDLLGIRQSGDAMFRIADVTRDGELLKMASSAALSLCETDPGLRAPENSTLKQAITSYMDENNRNLIL